MNEVAVILGISICFQLFAALFALRLIPITGKLGAWMLISAAIFLMAVRRSVTFYGIVTGTAVRSLDLPTELIALAISVLMFFGILKIASLFRSIQNSKETAQQVSEQRRIVTLLGHYAITETNLDTLLQRAVEMVADNLQVEYCKVLQLLPGGDELLLRAGIGWKKGLIGFAKVGAGANSQAGYTLLYNKPVVVTNMKREKRFMGPKLLHEHHVVSGMSVVIYGKDHPFGVLGAHTKEHRLFTEEDVEFLQSVANVLSEAVLLREQQFPHRKSA